MISGGDEIGRTQQGNNNTYCHDSPLSWYDWNNADEPFLAFTRRLIEFRRKHPVFRRRGWFQGKKIGDSDLKDIAWFTPSGSQMTEEDWNNGQGRAFGVYINGQTIPNPNAKGEPVTDDNFYILFNGRPEAAEFTLPGEMWGMNWLMELNTDSGWAEEEIPIPAGGTLPLEGRSLAVLRHEP